MTHSALGGLSDTRRQLLLFVKAAQQLTVDELADSLGITKSAVRQHVTGMEAAGLLEHVAERGRPGRPRFRYVLTRAAERLFPSRYDDVFIDVLSALDDRDPGLADEMLKDHFARRIEELPEDIGEKPVGDQLAQLVKVLDDDGHMPAVEQTGPESWTVTTSNCPLLHISEGRPGFCQVELEFFRSLAPGATIDCTQRIAPGGNACVHMVKAKASKD